MTLRAPPRRPFRACRVSRPSRPPLRCPLPKPNECIVYVGAGPIGPDLWPMPVVNAEASHVVVAGDMLDYAEPGDRSWSNACNKIAGAPTLRWQARYVG